MQYLTTILAAIASTALIATPALAQSDSMEVKNQIGAMLGASLTLSMCMGDKYSSNCPEKATKCTENDTKCGCATLGKLMAQCMPADVVSDKCGKDGLEARETFQNAMVERCKSAGYTANLDSAATGSVAVSGAMAGAVAMAAAIMAL